MAAAPGAACMPPAAALFADAGADREARFKLMQDARDEIRRLLCLPAAAFWNTILYGGPAAATAAPSPMCNPLDFLDEYLERCGRYIRNQVPPPYFTDAMAVTSLYGNGMVAGSNADALADSAQEDSLFLELELDLARRMFQFCVRLLTPPSGNHAKEPASMQATSTISDVDNRATGSGLPAAHIAEAPNHVGGNGSFDESACPRAAIDGTDIRGSPDPAWIDACCRHGIFSCIRIAKICQVYAVDNSAILKPLVSAILASTPNIATELVAAFMYVLETVQAIQRRREKATSGKSSVDGGGESKGKGKAKAVSSKDLSANDAHHNLANGQHASGTSSNKTDDSESEISFLIDTVTLIASVVRVGRPAISTPFVSDARLLKGLASVYNLATAQQSAASNSTDVAMLQDDRTAPLPLPHRLDSRPTLAAPPYTPAYAGTPSQDPIVTKAIQLKRSVLAFLNILIHVEFLDPAAASINNPHEYEQYLFKLCDFMLALFEITAADGPATYMCDAPMLLDHEIEYSLEQEIRGILASRTAHVHTTSSSLTLDESGKTTTTETSSSKKQLSCGGLSANSMDPFDDQVNAGTRVGDDADDSTEFDSTRVDYVMMSLEQLVTFSGNANTRREVMREREARKAVDAAAISGAETGDVDGDTVDNDIAVTGQNEAVMEDYYRRTLLISEVQSLFPDLGEGFIEACMVALDNSAEAVIMRILEDNLPDVVQHLDRSLPRTAPQLQHAAATSERDPVPLTMIPYSTQTSTLLGSGELTPVIQEEPDAYTQVLSSRRNIHDGDEFDVFSPTAAVDLSRVTLGKTDHARQVELESAEFVAGAKAAILATQYDDYDDEYDDTYDSTDIRLAGTVEVPLGDEREAMMNRRKQVFVGPPLGNDPDAASSSKPLDSSADPALAHEAYLVGLYTSDPGAFDPSQRKTAKRAEMRSRTAMSDEQLEGWFKMLERNPRKNKIMEKYEWSGNRSMYATTTADGSRGAGDAKEASRSSVGEQRSGYNGGGSSRGGGGSGSDRGRGGGMRGGRGGGDGRGGRGGRGGGRGAHKDARLRKISRGMSRPDGGGA